MMKIRIKADSNPSAGTDADGEQKDDNFSVKPA
jgi:hypothetical protein